jgi:hypothetical protein
MLIGTEKLQIRSAIWREYYRYNLLYIHYIEITVADSPLYILIHNIHNGVLSTVARVWSQVKSYRICGGKFGPEQVFSEYLGLPDNSLPPTPPHAIIILHGHYTVWTLTATLINKINLKSARFFADYKTYYRPVHKRHFRQTQNVLDKKRKILV